MSIAATAFSGKSENTIRLSAERYDTGRKIGGDWHISRVALRMFLDGDTDALATSLGRPNQSISAAVFRTRRGQGATKSK
jgi:hypothetical protein